MRELFLDLHIHSVLSPCADILMTPKNIIKKSIEKGIDVISITDHNSIGNLKSAIEIAKDKNLVIVPGIEVQSREDIHILSYFENLEDLNSYSEIIYDGLSNIKNDEETFGQQILVDENDQFIDREEKLLLNSTDYSINEILNLTYEYNGIPVPSHADRSFGLIKNLGFIPEGLNITYLELNFHKILAEYYKQFPYLKNFKLISSSDSHYLAQIEPKMKIKLTKRPTTKNIFDYIKKKRPRNYIIF
ncbi:MAG: PHP domain-containing protein [Halanaerobiales bacterium]